MSSSTRVRPTRAEVDLDALAHNLAVVRAAVRGSALWAVVKADAYGHGAVRVAQRLSREGVDGFCVALVEEGIELRDAGITEPILVLNGIYDGAHAEVVARELTPVVYEVQDLQRFDEVGGTKLHLKVDTGMHRLGVREADLTRFLEEIERRPRLRLSGLMTHLSSAETDEETTASQLARLGIARQVLRDRGYRDPVVHAANSAAALLRPAARLDAVRPGISLYGIRPVDDPTLVLRPVMRLVTSVTRLDEIATGEAVGYGGTWIAQRPTRVATLALGYGDGLMRGLSNVGSVAVGGVRCPIIGRISMDLTGVDVTDAPGARRGAEVTVFGGQTDGAMRAEEVAELLDTIGYEVVVSVSPRVPRVYREAPERP